MHYQPIEVDTLIRTITKKDTLFNGSYTIDPYQHCEFQCTYCDSSTKTTVNIKTNAPEILQNELPTLPKKTIIIGSVHDPYQPAEQHYHLTNKLLRIIKKHHFPCHILTKSTDVVHDIPLIKTMKTTVTLSLLSLNQTITRHLEPQTPTPAQRLQTLSILKKNGITAGIAVIPLLPYLIERELQAIIKIAHEHHTDYILHQYLEIKGDQKETFYQCLQDFRPDLIPKYQDLYYNDTKPKKTYQQGLTKKITTLCQKYKLQTTASANS